MAFFTKFSLYHMSINAIPYPLSIMSLINPTIVALYLLIYQCVTMVYVYNAVGPSIISVIWANMGCGFINQWFNSTVGVCWGMSCYLSHLSKLGLLSNMSRRDQRLERKVVVVNNTMTVRPINVHNAHYPVPNAIAPLRSVYKANTIF